MHTKAQQIFILTDDQVKLGATLFTSEPKSEHLIILCPATGAPQHLYQKMAQFASGRFEFDALTFDYRGVGASKTRSLKEDYSRLSDWGHFDLKAVIDWADKKYDKIFLLGHSIAGQIFPLASNHGRIEAVYFVGSQTAFHGYWMGWAWMKVLFFWYLSLPFTTAVYGYMPGWAMGGKVALPKNVAMEWKTWGTHMGGVIQGRKDRKKRFDEVKIPIHFVSIEDDRLMAPFAATKELMHYYSNAKTSYQFIRPRDLGVRKIGHFGFFRSKHQEKLWSMPILFFTQFVEKICEIR